MKVAMSQQEQLLIRSYISKDSVVLEYGSGGSTFHFAPLAKKYVSIEHDKGWYETTNNFAEVYLIEPDKEWHGECDGTYEQFKSYIEKIRDFDYKFNIVIVDGRARDCVLKELLNHIDNNTVVLLHDCDRYDISDYIVKHQVHQLMDLRRKDEGDIH